MLVIGIMIWIKPRCQEIDLPLVFVDTNNSVDIIFTSGNAFLNEPFSSASHLIIEFDYATVNDDPANCTFGIGDGLAFYLTDGTAAPSLGEVGAALGYSHAQTGNPANVDKHKNQQRTFKVAFGLSALF